MFTNVLHIMLQKNHIKDIIEEEKYREKKIQKRGIRV